MNPSVLTYNIIYSLRFQVGSEVTKFALGDKIGIGCIADSCGSCPDCLSQEEDGCRKGFTMSFGAEEPDNEYGGYSSHYTVNEKFGVKIPEHYPLEYAGANTSIHAQIYANIY